MKPSPTKAVPQGIAGQRSADAIMLIALAVAALAAVLIDIAFDQTVLAALLSGAIGAVGVGAFLLARGRPLCRIVLAFGLCSEVALHIQLAHGELHYHFGVFIAMSVLLVYRDWRYIVGAAVFFAVHHLGFDRLQAFGVGVFCMSRPSLPTVALHASYVVAQAGVEILIAVGLRRLAEQSEEIERLSRAVVADGRVSLDLGHQDVRTRLARALKQAIGTIDAAIAQVRRSVAEIESAGAVLSNGNDDLNGRAGKAAAHLDRTAALLDRLTGSVAQSSEATREADALATSAARIAARGGEVVTQVVSTMDGINASSRRIGDIVGVIDGIAFQTNILALNAAVEAARAGEHGRGFAVVASEVRSLAKRSAEAAGEIKVLIGGSVAQVEAGARRAADAGTTMAEIVRSFEEVARIIGAISASAADQAHGIVEANQSIAELGEMTRDNVALVERSTESTRSLHAQTTRMSEVVATFDGQNR